MSNIGKIITTFLTSSVAIAGVLFYLAARDFDEGLKPVSDISRYRELLSTFETDALMVKHFPPEIPSDAQNTRLYFVPGFLQGGTIFQLRMQLPPKKIENIQAQFRKTAKLKYIPDSNNNSLKAETSPQGVLINHEYIFHTGELSDQPFPKNYEILVLEDTSGAPKYEWKHSTAYGVAIDSSMSEVVYWAEAW
jgi:hypothetical protein